MRAQASTARVAILFASLALAGAAFAGPGRFTPIGPEGGDIRVIRVDPSDPRVVYAGARLGGVFKSTDGGGSWRRLAAVPADDNQLVLDLVLDPTQPSTLYVTFGGTVQKSRDAGATFTAAGSGIGAYFVQGLAIDPQTPAILYAATYSGLYKTRDAGGSWQLASPDLEELYVTSVAVDPRAPLTVFVGVEDEPGGVFKSTDGGATWTQKTAGLPPSSFGEGTVQVVVDPQAAGRVFATYTSLNSRRPKNFRSTDGGETWAEMAGADDYPLAAGPGGLVFAGGKKSTDGGETWAATGVPGTPLFSLAIDPASGKVYAGSGVHGISQSTDQGASWQSTNRGLWATEVTGLAVDAKAPGVLFAGVTGARLWARPLASGVFRIQNRTGNTPIYAFYGLDPDPATPRVLYSAYGGSILKSVDGGKTFEIRRLPNPIPPYFIYADLAVDPTAPETLYAGGYPYADRFDSDCDTFKSTDGGATWRCMALDRLFRIYVHPARPATVYALDGAGVFQSSDRGESWHNLRPGFQEEGFQCLAFDPRRANVLYAGAGIGTGPHGIWRSADGGVSWVPWSRGFNLPVSELIVDPRTPGVLYAGVDRIDIYPQGQAGVYRSTDSGRTWSKIPGLPGALFNGLLAFDPIRGTLYAGTLEQGVYAATMPR